MTISQAAQIHELHQRIATLERENGILQHQVDSLLRQMEDAQHALTHERAIFDRLTLLEPALDDEDTQRDVPTQDY
jgi:KaiC/GvpD/RAD55 family RecA-like ATPase